MVASHMVHTVSMRSNERVISERDYKSQYHSGSRIAPEGQRVERCRYSIVPRVSPAETTESRERKDVIKEKKTGKRNRVQHTKVHRDPVLRR